jgi:hypothetical protein
MTFIAGMAAGFLTHDVAVYCWHRWVSHAGVLRWFGNDMFRRRHFNHHLVQYPPLHLHAPAYVESCDVTFGFVDVLLLIGAVLAVSLGTVPLSWTFAAACGGTLHGWLAIRIHEFCHILENGVPRRTLLHQRISLPTLERLRLFHNLHHTGRGNYGLLIPVIDIVAGTSARLVADPARLPAELFPGFLPERSSSCGEALI